MVFVSDLPRSWTEPSREVQPVSTDLIIEHLTRLPYLEQLDIRKAKWLSRDNVELLVLLCPSLVKVDFLGSGNVKDDSPTSGVGHKDSVFWAIKGPKQLLAELIDSSGPHSVVETLDNGR